MKVTKEKLVEGLQEDGEFYGKDNSDKPFFGKNFAPAVILIVEKNISFERIKEELIGKNIKNVFLLSITGFPHSSTTKKISELKAPSTKVYYFGDMDPVSFLAYYSLKKGDNSFKKSTDKLQLKFLGINSDDLKRYEIPQRYRIKLRNEEHVMLNYIIENNLLPELGKEINFIKKSGYKAESEVLHIALDVKGFTFLNYLRLKGIKI